MTVALGYRIAGEGAVMACDGRILDGDSHILSDGDKKFVICGPTVAFVAGNFGKLFHKIAANPPKSFATLRAAITENVSDDTEWLAYDKRADRLYINDLVIGRPIAGIGAGSSYGLGALEALPLAKTMDTAYRYISIAMGIACRRNASCGGRIRVLVIPRQGPIQFRAPAPSGIAKDPKEPKD
jgi:hypothetical protein